MKGRSIANMWGKFTPGEQVTVFACRGMVQARQLAKVIHMPITKKMNFVKSVIAKLSYSANQLDIQGRSEWGACATTYCAYLKEKHSVAKFPWYMTPHSKEPPNWLSYYMYCNIIAAHSEMIWPRQKAPLAGGRPPAPMIRWAKYDEKNHKVIGEFELMPLTSGDREFRVRIFLAGQYIVSIPPSIHKIIHLSPDPTNTKKSITVKFEFDRIRCAGFIFDQKELMFRDMPKGSIYIYADAVTAYSHEHGPHASVFSSPLEVMIPPRVDMRSGGMGKKWKITFYGEKLRPEAIKLFHRLRGYKRRVAKRYKANVIQRKVKWDDD